MVELEKGYVILSLMNVNYKQYGICGASINEVNEMKKVFQEILKDYKITDSVDSKIFYTHNDEYRLKDDLDLSDVDSYYKYIFLQGNQQLKILWDDKFVYDKLLDIRHKNIDYFKPANLEDIINKVLPKPDKFYEDIVKELSTTEYAFIQNLLDNRECNTCSNNYCTNEDRSQNYNNNCSKYVNPERVGKVKVLLKG